jgi:hypothetical protein
MSHFPYQICYDLNRWLIEAQLPAAPFLLPKIAIPEEVKRTNELPE